MNKYIRSLVIFSAFIVSAFAFAGSAEAGYRTVQAGDDLYKMFGNRGFEVCRINGLSNCNLVFPGQVLNDGLGGTATVQSAPVQTVAPTTTIRQSGGPNGYGAGWCTWYVKERRPDIGGYWGNAGYNWLTAAQNAGFSTGYTPQAGAIGVMAGHVVYVESVSGNMVNISEMGWNYQAWNKNYRTVPASSFVYIY